MYEVPAFLYDALRFQDPRVDRLRLVKDSEWKAVLSSWRVVRLTLPLRQVCDEDLPDWVLARIDTYLADNTLRFERIKQIYSAAASAFRRAHAEHAVLKGFSLWPGYVEHPRFRPQSDIDIYCPPESIGRARDALVALAYEPSHLFQHARHDHVPIMAPKTSWQWRGKFFDPEIPVSFELHFRWWDSSFSRIFPEGLEEFWFRRIERHLDDIVFPGLDAADNLGYAALNLLRDFLRVGWVAPEQVYGLARFLHTTAVDHTFWRRWQWLHSASLRRLELISFLMAQSCFSCSLAEELREETERLPPEVLTWFRYFSKSVLVGPYSSRMKDSLWLHLNLLESVRDKASVLFRRLLPVPQSVPTVRSVLPDRQRGTGEENSSLRLLQSCQRSVQLAAWVAQRVASHLFAVACTVLRGVGYWLYTRNFGRQFWTFFAASFCYDLGMTMFFFLYNVFLLDRGYKEEFLGLMMGAMNVGSLACSIPAGILVQRLGLRKSMLLCLSLVSSVSVACTLFEVRSVLLGLAFLAGFVSTIWAVAISPAVARLTDERSRPYGFSLVFSSGIGVSVLATLVASRLPGWFSHLNPALFSSQSKHLALLVACAIVALGLFPISRLRFAPSPVAVAEEKLYPSSPFVWRFLLAVGLWGAVTGSLSPLSNVYFSKYLRMPLERMGVIFSFSRFFQALGVLFAPFLFRRLGLVSGIAATQLATAALLALLATTTRALPTAVIYIGFTAFLWMSEPGLRTLLMDRVAPTEQAGASALNYLVISLVQAVAVVATGTSFSKFGYPAVLAALAGLALMASLSFLGLIGRHSLVPAKSASARAGV
jgi:MFS family permease